MSDRKVVLEVAAFLDSPEARGLRGVERSELKRIAEWFVEACYEELGKKPSKLDSEDIRALLLRSLPARLKADDPGAQHVPQAIRAYLDYLETVEVVSQAFEVRNALEESTEDFYETVRSGRLAGTTGTKHPDPFVHGAPKTGRNDPCWCGSGRKFKKCHGKNA